jgi:hypothetical protein
MTSQTSSWPHSGQNIRVSIINEIIFDTPLHIEMGQGGAYLAHRVREEEEGCGWKKTEVIRCRGHPNVTALHPTTFEITMDDELSVRGDCIIGIAAEIGLPGLSPEFRDLLACDDALLVTVLRCEDLEVGVRSEGSGAMALDHSSDFVWRTSSFVCGRTVGIRSDAAARDLPRELVALLRQGKELLVEMTVAVRE